MCVMGNVGLATSHKDDTIFDHTHKFHNLDARVQFQQRIKFYNIIGPGGDIAMIDIVNIVNVMDALLLRQ